MPYVQSTDEMIEGSVAVAQAAGLIHDGEIAVVTAGVARRASPGPPI